MQDTTAYHSYLALHYFDHPPQYTLGQNCLVFQLSPLHLIICHNLLSIAQFPLYTIPFRAIQIIQHARLAHPCSYFAMLDLLLLVLVSLQPSLPLHISATPFIPQEFIRPTTPFPHSYNLALS